MNYVAGKIGQALGFDGIDDYVEIANSSSLELNRQLTITYVMAPQLQLEQASPNLKTGIPVLVKGRHTGNNYASWIRGDLSYVSFQQYPNSTYSSDTKSSFGVSNSFVAGEFVRITIVRDNNEVKIYLNCKLLSEYEANYDANEKQQSLFIGYDGGYGYKKFKGILDDLRVYNRALSEDEIQSFNTGEDKCISPTTCQLYGVHDEGLNNSQFLTISPETFEVNALGEGCPGCDIEALDILHKQVNYSQLLEIIPISQLISIMLIKIMVN